MVVYRINDIISYERSYCQGLVVDEFLLLFVLLIKQKRLAGGALEHETFSV